MITEASETVSVKMSYGQHSSLFCPAISVTVLQQYSVYNIDESKCNSHSKKIVLRDKCSSLFHPTVSDEDKMFMVITDTCEIVAIKINFSLVTNTLAYFTQQ